MGFFSSLFSIGETATDIGQYFGMGNKWEAGADAAEALKKMYKNGGLNGDTVGDLMGAAADGFITGKLKDMGVPGPIATALGEAAQLAADKLVEAIADKFNGDPEKAATAVTNNKDIPIKQSAESLDKAMEDTGHDVAAAQAKKEKFSELLKGPVAQAERPKGNPDELTLDTSRLERFTQNVGAMQGGDKAHDTEQNLQTPSSTSLPVELNTPQRESMVR